MSILRPALDDRHGEEMSSGTRDMAASTRGRPRIPLRVLDPRRMSAVYLWIVFIILFTALKPGIYLSSINLNLIFTQGPVICVLALAFLVPLAAGAYDLSIGAVMALAIAISVWLQINTGLPPILGAVIAIIVCAAVGFLSGTIVVRLKVNSFIATLGMSEVLLAAVLLLSGDRQLIATFPNSWTSLGQNRIAGIPLVAVYMIVLAALVWYVLEHTRIGRYLFATGGNPEAARLSGVATGRITCGALTASGVLAGLAGVIYSMQVGIFDSSVGPGYLFPAAAAVFLGASQFSRRPNVWGTLIAYFALAFGIQGITLSSSSGAVWSEPLFQGVALIVAVALASLPSVRRRVKARLAVGSRVGSEMPAAGAYAGTDLPAATDSDLR
jgi:ribose transport system permease protein